MELCRILLSMIFVGIILLLLSGVGPTDGISPCGSGRFWCTNNRCLRSQYVCDNVDDCGDNSDERSCQASDDCGTGQFYCGFDQCIAPDLVCDSNCDCHDGECEDERSSHCYQSTGRYFSPLSLGLPLAIVATVIACYGIYQIVHGKACRRRSRRQSAAQPQRNTEIDISTEEGRPDILDDLPPAYDSIVDNSMFIIDSESMNEDPVEPLPSYEDATSPGADVINPSSDSAQPPPPSYDSVKLPRWVSNEENRDPPGVEPSYNVVYYNHSPRFSDIREDNITSSIQDDDIQSSIQLQANERTNSEIRTHFHSTSSDLSTNTSSNTCIDTSTPSSTSSSSSSSSSTSSSGSGTDTSSSSNTTGDLPVQYNRDVQHESGVQYDNQAYESEAPERD